MSFFLEGQMCFIKHFQISRLHCISSDLFHVSTHFPFGIFPGFTLMSERVLKYKIHLGLRQCGGGVCYMCVHTGAKPQLVLQLKGGTKRRLQPATGAMHASRIRLVGCVRPLFMAHSPRSQIPGPIILPLTPINAISKWANNERAKRQQPKKPQENDVARTRRWKVIKYKWRCSLHKKPSCVGRPGRKAQQWAWPGGGSGWSRNCSTFEHS